MRGMIALTLASSSSFACPWLHSGLLVAQIWQTSLRPSQCHLSVQYVGQRNVSGIILLSKLAGVNCHTNTITISVHNIQLINSTCIVNAERWQHASAHYALWFWGTKKAGHSFWRLGCKNHTNRAGDGSTCTRRDTGENYKRGVENR